MLLAVHDEVAVYLGSMARNQEATAALDYRHEQLLCFFRALQTSLVYRNSIVYVTEMPNANSTNYDTPRQKR